MISHEVEPCGCRIGVRAQSGCTWHEGNLRLTIIYCGDHNILVGGRKLREAHEDLDRQRAELSRLRGILRGIKSGISGL
jgi:hypothetical protein